MRNKLEQSIKLTIKNKNGVKNSYQLVLDQNLVIATCTCGSQFLVLLGEHPINMPFKKHLIDHTCDVDLSPKQLKLIKC